jgi:solute carrier family 25 protein 44
MVWRAEGIPGFYRGFGTVVFGTIPARTIYLTSLEITKSTMQK